MQMANRPHIRAFRDKYLAALLGAAALLLIAASADAQRLTDPNGYGGRSHREAPDSTSYIPTACGVPTDSTFLFSQGFAGQGQKMPQAAKYYDSCGHHEYTWDPSLKAWHISDGAGGSNDTTNLSFRLDTLASTKIDQGTLDDTAAALRTAIASIPGGGMSNPMTTQGDMISGSAGGSPIRIIGNTTTTKEFLSQAGTGSAANNPVMSTIAQSDVVGLSTALNAKVANTLASTGISAGPLGSRPAASNCHCYYFSTTDSTWSYDNGAWIPAKGGSASGSGPVSTDLWLFGDGTSGLPLGFDSARLGSSFGIDTLSYVDTLGTLFYDTLYTGFTNAYYTFHGSASPSITGNRCILASTSNNDLNSFIEPINYQLLSQLQSWRHTLIVQLTSTPSSSTYGIGLMKASGATAIYGGINLTTGTDAGKLTIETPTAVLATSSSAISFSQNDIFKIEMLYRHDSAYITVQNLTTGNPAVTLSFAFNYNSPFATSSPQATGSYSIAQKGGAYSILSDGTTSSVPLRAPIAAVGDSKTAGYFAGAPGNRFSSLLNDQFTVTTNFGNSGDKTQDLLSRQPEIIASHPEAVLLCIGRNDLAAGLNWRANYKQIVDIFKNAGILVYHVVIWESSVDQSSLVAYIDSAYHSDYISSVYLSGQTCGSSCIVADGIHPNAPGNDSVFVNVVRDKRINKGNYRLKTGYIDASLMGTSQNIDAPIIVNENGTLMKGGNPPFLSKTKADTSLAGKTILGPFIVDDVSSVGNGTTTGMSTFLFGGDTYTDIHAGQYFIRSPAGSPYLTFDPTHGIVQFPGVLGLQLIQGSGDPSPVPGELWVNGSSYKGFDGSSIIDFSDVYLRAATIVATANYTETGVSNYWVLPDLTGQANRVLTPPQFPTTGRPFSIYNKNSSVFSWSFGGVLPLKDVAGSTITTIPNQTIYRMVYDGANYQILTVYDLSGGITQTALDDTAAAIRADFPSAGGSPPFDANTAILKDHSDNTKTLKFNLASITTSTARTITMPNTSLTIAGIDIAQTFTQLQTFSAGIAVSNIATTGSTPAGTPGNGVPTGGGATSGFGSGSNTVSGVWALTTGTGSATAGGLVVTITLPGSHSSKAIVIIQDILGSEPGTVASMTDATHFTINLKTGQSLAASTSFEWSYLIID